MNATNKITITFPDGNSREVNKGISGFEIAEQISKSLAKDSIAFKANGEIQDLARIIDTDSSIEII